MREILGIILVLLLVFGIACGLGAWAGTASCNAKTRDMNVPHRYDLLADCMVQQNGMWIPIESWNSDN